MPSDQGLTLTISFNLQFSSVQSLSRVQLFVTPWVAAHQASLSITNSMNMGLGGLQELGGQGGLACCSSWGCKESDTTE